MAVPRGKKPTQEAAKPTPPDPRRPKPGNTEPDRERARIAEDRLAKMDEKQLIDWDKVGERGQIIITDLRRERGNTKGFDAIGPWGRMTPPEE